MIRYLQTLDETGSVGGAVAATQALNKHAGKMAQLFIELMAEDDGCKFKLVQHGTYGEQSNSMVCFTLKDNPSEERVLEWQSRFADDVLGTKTNVVWASNSLQIPQEDGSKITTLRVNFIRPGHSEKTVKEVYAQLQATASE